MATAKFQVQDKKSTYIYHLPYRITQQICSNLDVDRAWSKLASEIGYTYQDVKRFDLVYQQPSGSPTEKLLSDWGCRNHTAIDLFNKLRCIQRVREAQILEAWFTSSEAEVIYPPRNTPGASGTNLLEDLHHADLPKPVPPGKTPPSVDGGKEPIQNSSKYMDNVNINGPGKFSQGSKVMPDKMVGGKSMTSLGKPLNDKVITEDKKQMKSSLEKMAEKPEKGEKKCEMLSVKENAYSMTGGPEVAKGNKGNKSLDVQFMNRLESVDSSLKEMFTDVDECMAMMGTPSFTYKAINQATNGFSEKQTLGTGQYGEVYFGRLKNTDCAIKKLFSRNEKPNSQNQLPSELKILTKYRHMNIVPLYGYTLEASEIFLVYEYMQNGSLYDKLHGKDRAKPLPWEQRVAIMKGVACGLQYLHTMDSTPLIHGDMKSSNILLDKHMDAKISDLGMARHATSATSGSSGILTHITKQQTDTKEYQDKVYLPPECMRGSVMSIKGDTFSYGVVLLEVCTGEKAYDEKREGVDSSNLVSYKKNLLEDNASQLLEPDPKGGNCPQDLYKKLFKIADSCTKDMKRQRPDMVQVYKDMEELEISWNEYSLSSNGYSKPDESMSTNYSTDYSTDHSTDQSHLVRTEQDQMVPSKLVIPASGNNSFPAMPGSMTSSDDININVQSPDTVNSNEYQNDFVAVKHKLQDIGNQTSGQENPIWSSAEENDSQETGDMSDNVSEVCEGVQDLNVSEVVNNTELTEKQKRDMIFENYNRQNQAIINSEQDIDLADFDEYGDDFFNSELETMVQTENSEQCESKSVVNLSANDIVADGHVMDNNIDDNTENSGAESSALNSLSFHQQKFAEYQKLAEGLTGTENTTVPDAGCENCAELENTNNSVSHSLVMHKHKYNAYQEIAENIDQKTTSDGHVEQKSCDNLGCHGDNEGADLPPKNSLNCDSADYMFGSRKISPSNPYWQQKRAEPSESDECYV